MGVAEVVRELQEIADHIDEFAPASASDLREHADWIVGLVEQFEAYREALDKIANAPGRRDNEDERLIAHRALSNRACDE